MDYVPRHKETHAIKPLGMAGAKQTITLESVGSRKPHIFFGYESDFGSIRLQLEAAEARYIGERLIELANKAENPHEELDAAP